MPSNVGEKAIRTLASITRKFHPRGTERILRLIHNPDSRQGDSIETVIPYDGNLKININTNSFIEWFIFFKGVYEPEMVKLIKRNLPEGGVFVDVGANIGLFTMIAAKIANRVIAVEPIPEFAARLKQNLDLNGIQNVQIVQGVASDEGGEVPIYLPEGSNKGEASLYPEIYPGRTLTKKIMVKSYTLDDLLKNENKVDFIKIDAQGHDQKVIAGAKNIIEKFSPVVIYENEKNENVILRPSGK